MKKENNHNVGISQNVAWITNKSSWIMHIIIVFLFQIILSTFLDKSKSWQLSLTIYNIITFVFFHCMQGDPFTGDYYNYTFWEQVTEQLEDSSGTIFLAIFPLIVFIFLGYFTKWDSFFVIICAISLTLVIIPKLGFMQYKRIFGIWSKD